MSLGKAISLSEFIIKSTVWKEKKKKKDPFTNMEVYSFKEYLVIKFKIRSM